MKIILLILIIALTGLFVNAQTVIYQTLPGTSIKDYTKPGYVIDKNIIYPTYPGTSIRDYTSESPSYKIEKNTFPQYKKTDYTIYETLPGTNVRDYSKPGIVIENKNQELYFYDDPDINELEVPEY